MALFNGFNILTWIHEATFLVHISSTSTVKRKMKNMVKMSLDFKLREKFCNSVEFVFRMWLLPLQEMTLERENTLIQINIAWSLKSCLFCCCF